MHFSKDCKDETKDSTLFILNNTKIKTDDKTHYLIGQKELLDDDSKIDTDEMKSFAYSLFLINPTWKNVQAYYMNENNEEDVLIEYIEHFADRLGNQMAVEDNKNEYSSLASYLLGTTKLNFKTFSSIIKSFRGEFNGYKGLIDLDRDRLLLLLSHNMLPFSEENTNLLKETEIYHDYLLKHHQQFLEQISFSYISDSKVAHILLSSNVFTYEEKKKIITNTPKEIFIESTELANLVLNVIINTNLNDIEAETIIEILEKASNTSYKVYIISSLILTYNYDDNQITKLLSLLGDKYADIADQTKHPILEKTEWNIQLAKVLFKKGYVSSAKRDKDGIRIHRKGSDN